MTGNNDNVAASDGSEVSKHASDNSQASRLDNTAAEQPVDPLIEQMNSVLHLDDQLAGSSGHMDIQASPATSHLASTGEHNRSGLWRLIERPAAATANERRARRFSDTDRNGNSNPVAKSTFAPNCPKLGSSMLSISNAPPPTLLELEGEAAKPSARGPSTALSPHECYATDCAVSKVFGTTELLEYILTWIETRDILNLRRVDRAWNDAIKASPQLRLHLFAYPLFRKPAADFELLPISFPGLSSRLGEPLDRGQWIELAMTREAALELRSDDPSRRRRPRARSIFEGLRGGLGSNRGALSNDPWPATALQKTSPCNAVLKYEDLYITQPPVCAMQGFVYEQSYLLDSVHGDIDEHEPSACAKLSCDTGITLGFLAEAALSVLPASSSSGRPSIKEMRDVKKGKMKQVVFKAIMSFTDEHSKSVKRCGSKQVILLGTDSGSVV